ncbi:GvpL/GvpF family gas vesicle protein [Citricoccus sp. GCM10030269]|uniref:GvpL/GvpF family gas vesicle protein n=1 Tax=Citricoccus sp. GCM10030269 TaxID=3273388 RepID=UPI0036155537
MSAPGLYVYAIVPAADTATELGTGINNSAVRTVVAAGGLAAVVHEHDDPPYQGPDSEVERWVLEHSDVVDRAWESAGTILPVSFNVIVSPDEGSDTSADERLVQWLTTNASALSTHLDRLRGMVELRVEISLNQEAVGETSEEVRALREDLDHRPPGVQRLYRKRLATLEQEVTERLADRLYPDFRRRLAALSTDLAETRSPARTPGLVSVLSVSLLVPDDGVQQVGLELAAIRDERPGSEIRYLGPWPPYSFADVPELGSAGVGDGASQEATAGE